MANPNPFISSWLYTNWNGWFYADNWFFFNEMANSEVSALYYTLQKATFHWIYSDQLIAKLDGHSKVLSTFQIRSSESKDN